VDLSVSAPLPVHRTAGAPPMLQRMDSSASVAEVPLSSRLPLRPSPLAQAAGGASVLLGSPVARAAVSAPLPAAFSPSPSIAGVLSQRMPRGRLHPGAFSGGSAYLPLMRQQHSNPQRRQLSPPPLPLGQRVLRPAPLGDCALALAPVPAPSSAPALLPSGNRQELDSAAVFKSLKSVDLDLAAASRLLDSAAVLSAAFLGAGGGRAATSRCPTAVGSTTTRQREQVPVDVETLTPVKVCMSSSELDESVLVSSLVFIKTMLEESAARATPTTTSPQTTSSELGTTFCWTPTAASELGGLGEDVSPLHTSRVNGEHDSKASLATLPRPAAADGEDWQDDFVRRWWVDMGLNVH